MKRTAKLTFRDDEQWAAYKETMRRLKKMWIPQATDPTEADHVVYLCTEWLDRPATPPQSGEGRS